MPGASPGQMDMLSVPTPPNKTLNPQRQQQVGLYQFKFLSICVSSQYSHSFSREALQVPIGFRMMR